MTNVVETTHDKHGSAMFVRNDLVVESTSRLSSHDIEILFVELDYISITSVYKPPPTSFALLPIPPSQKPQVVIRDFNSHNSFGDMRK